MLGPYRAYFVYLIRAKEKPSLAYSAFTYEHRHDIVASTHVMCPAVMLAVDDLVLCPSSARRARVVHGILTAMRDDSIDAMRHVLGTFGVDVALLMRDVDMDPEVAYIQVAHKVMQLRVAPCMMFHQFAFTLDWQRGDDVQWVHAHAQAECRAEDKSVNAVKREHLTVRWETTGGSVMLRSIGASTERAVQFEVGIPNTWIRISPTQIQDISPLDDVGIGTGTHTWSLGAITYQYAVTDRGKTKTPEGVRRRVSRLTRAALSASSPGGQETMFTVWLASNPSPTQPIMAEFLGQIVL